VIQIIKLKRDIAMAEIRLQDEKSVIRNRCTLVRRAVLSRISSPRALVTSFVCGFCVATIGNIGSRTAGAAPSTLSKIARQGFSLFVFPTLYSMIMDFATGTVHDIGSSLKQPK
jgi:hypothetical protein